MGITTKAQKLIVKFWPISVILLLVAIFAYPYWAKGLVPFPSSYLVTFFPPWQHYFGMPVKNNAMPDVLSQMYPFRHLVINFWKSKQIPLWNPYNFSGNPLLANYQSAVFHPANFLFFILPEIDAWSLMILLQPLLAGLFTYLFCRQLKLNQAASLLSAVAFMFCGFMTVWLAYGTMSWALLWLPLTLYAIERSFRKIAGFSLVLISLSLAASFFSGHFQTSLYVFLAAVFYLFFRLITSRKIKTFLICLVFISLGVFLAFIQILPTLELYNFSVRSITLDVSEIIPWSYTPTILAPDFYGNPVTRNDWFGHYAEWASFTGVIPFILVLYGLLRKRKSIVYFFSLLAFTSLILTRPTPALDLMVKLKIPVLSSSAVARINSLFSFSVAVLAGLGLGQIFADFKKRNFKAAIGISLLFILVFLGLWGFLLFKSPFSPEVISIAKRNLILPAGMTAAFGSLVFAYWLLDHFFSKKKLLVRNFRYLFVLIILLLSIFDVFRFAQKWMPFDHKDYVYPSVPVLDFLTQKSGNDRLFGFFGMEMQNYFRILGFDGYDPLYIQRYGELLMAAKDGKIRLPSTRGVSLGRREKYTMKLLNLLGGKYILHAISEDRYDWVFNWWDYPEQFKEIYYEENKYQIFENLKTFPRAFIVYDYRVEKEPQKIIDLMFSDETDLRKTVVLEEEPESIKPKVPPKSSPEVTIIDYSPNEVLIGVKTQASGLLFLSDNYFPGWRAFVDNAPAKVYRANYSFRAVEIPEGKHQIKFIYQPGSFQLGATISGASVLFIGLLAVVFGKKYL